MKISISDRELLSVLFYLRGVPPGEDQMEIGLQLFEAFKLGDSRFSMPPDGNIDLTAFSSELNEVDLTAEALAGLRAILSRPGQAPAMWLSSARCLRRIREAADPKGLTSVA